MVWQKFFAQNSVRIGVVIAAFLLVLIVVAPFFLPYSANEQNLAEKLSAPDARHVLGTDQFGRDVLARIADGGRRSLGAAILVLTLTLFFSLILGIIIGLVGGILETAMMRVIDVLLALPPLVLALAVVGVLGAGFRNLMFAIIVSALAFYTKLTGSYVKLIRQRPDIVVARLSGISWTNIIAGHIFPHVFAQMLIFATLDLGGTIIGIAGLSFLGLGASPPDAEWGVMLNESRLFFTTAPWLLLAPATVIFLSVVSANLIGNALRDAND